MGKRGSGILLHITSLPSAYGIGDLGSEAYRFVDFLSMAKQAYWQILPLNPTNHFAGDSPYFSCSAFAGNPLMISPERLMNKGLLCEEDINPIPIFPEGITDFDAVVKYKGEILDKAYENFKRSSKPSDYDDFCDANAYWLDDFALFMVLKDVFKGEVWSKWPDEFKLRDEDAINEAFEKYGDEIERQRFFQYVFEEQWAALRFYCKQLEVKIIGDLPIYVSYDSVDVWVYPELFKLDDNLNPTEVSGVPPDYFSKTGQLWNNPVYRWDVLKQNSFDWWVKRFGITFGRFDIVRIDHFRGLVQFWEIPAGEETAINGKWQPVPVLDFFDTIKGHFHEFPVIAEDLGYITSDVREVMDRYHFPGMKILLFAFGGNNGHHPYLPHNFDKNCVVYTGTHDNNTFVGWFDNEISENEKEKFLDYTDKKLAIKGLNWDIIRLAEMSVADTAIIPMQDIIGLGQEARMNQPSTPAGNWRWRLKPGEIKKTHIDKLAFLAVLYGRA
ncbi:MAG TPA: 4-alpha-glucanotransferase [Candidatus Omnitrophota bacterium]|nr:4-alpha-glucanotransferase [Candidatus Omnitrophota bacterium]HPS20774.1 4-alpha-glucanotransferase [Candidatus Omnitrophota bacterium]